MPRTPDAEISIRDAYARAGVAQFYAQCGDRYRNPHERGVQTAIAAFAEHLPAGTLLDLAAGSGEVTLALLDAGRAADDISACDPYTSVAYRQRTGRDAELWSFEMLASGFPNRYSAIVCSFALHLCPESWLPSLVVAMSGATEVLLVLTPHKKPHLRPEWGMRLEEERYFTEHRVRARLYRSERAR